MKKIIAIFLSAAMLVSAMPMLAFASVVPESHKAIAEFTIEGVDAEAIVEAVKSGNWGTIPSVEAKDIQAAYQVAYTHAVKAVEKYQEKKDEIDAIVLASAAFAHENYGSGEVPAAELNKVIFQLNVAIKFINADYVQIKAIYDAVEYLNAKYGKYIPVIEAVTGIEIPELGSFDVDWANIQAGIKLVGAQIASNPKVQAYVAAMIEKYGVEEAIAKVEEVKTIGEALHANVVEAYQSGRLSKAAYAAIMEDFDVEATVAYIEQLEAQIAALEAENKELKDNNADLAKALKVASAKGSFVSVVGGKKKITASWKAIDEADGYEFYYYNKSTKKSYVKTVDATEFQKTGLKAKKSYRVKVRAYVYVGGKKYVSRYSDTTTVKTK